MPSWKLPAKIISHETCKNLMLLLYILHLQVAVWSIRKLKGSWSQIWMNYVPKSNIVLANIFLWTSMKTCYKAWTLVHCCIQKLLIKDTGSSITTLKWFSWYLQIRDLHLRPSYLCLCSKVKIVLEFPINHRTCLKVWKSTILCDLF